MAGKDNVLFILPTLCRGGLERAALSAAGAICADFSPYFLTLAEYQIEYSCPYEGYKSFKLLTDENDSPYKLIRALLFVKRFIRCRSFVRLLKKELNVKYTFSYASIADMVNAVTGIGEKRIFSIRSYKDVTVRGFRRLWYRFIYRRADTVTCVSDEIRDTMPKVLGLSKKKFVSLYNPYNTEQIKTEAAKPCDFIKQGLTLVAFGRLNKVKGFDLLLKAFKRILNVRKDVQLIFVGGGDEQKSLEELSKDLGVAENVSFLGLQTEPFRYVSKGDLFVMSSLNEGLPNAMIEAMACGLPIVSVDCHSGPREILDPGRSEPVKGIVKAQYGILTPELSRSMDAVELDKRLSFFSDAVLMLLENEDLRLDYAKRAKERAEDFSIDKFRDKLYQIMQSI